MTDTADRLRAILLAVLMVGSVFAGTIAFAGGTAAAATLQVSGGGNALQEAINDASPGDTIVISDSLTYNGVDITKDDLVIESADGESPTVDGGDDHAVDVQGWDVTLNGLTLTANTGVDVVEAASGSDLTVEDSTIWINDGNFSVTKNTAGIDIHGSLHVDGTTFTTASTNGTINSVGINKTGQYSDSTVMNSHFEWLSVGVWHPGGDEDFLVWNNGFYDITNESVIFETQGDNADNNDVLWNTFRNVTHGVAYVERAAFTLDDGSLDVHNNNFAEISGWGLVTDTDRDYSSDGLTSAMVDATDNWWDNVANVDSDGGDVDTTPELDQPVRQQSESGTAVSDNQASRTNVLEGEDVTVDGFKGGETVELQPAGSNTVLATATANVTGTATIDTDGLSQGDYEFVGAESGFLTGFITIEDTFLEVSANVSEVRTSGPASETQVEYTIATNRSVPSSEWTVSVNGTVVEDNVGSTVNDGDSWVVDYEGFSGAMDWLVLTDTLTDDVGQAMVTMETFSSLDVEPETAVVWDDSSGGSTSATFTVNSNHTGSFELNITGADFTVTSTTATASGHNWTTEDGDTFTLDFAGVDPATYDILFQSEGTAESDTVQVAVAEADIPADATVEFASASNYREIGRGDLLQRGIGDGFDPFMIQMENTNVATIVFGGQYWYAPSGYWANMTVIDGNGDGYVNLTINTFQQGHTADAYEAEDPADHVIDVNQDTLNQNQLIAMGGEGEGYDVRAKASHDPVETSEDPDDQAAFALHETETEYISNLIAPSFRDFEEPLDFYVETGVFADFQPYVGWLDQGPNNESMPAVDSEVAVGDKYAAEVFGEGYYGIIEHFEDQGAANPEEAFVMANQTDWLHFDMQVTSTQQFTWNGPSKRLDLQEAYNQGALEVLPAAAQYNFVVVVDINQQVFRVGGPGGQLERAKAGEAYNVQYARPKRSDSTRMRQQSILVAERSVTPVELTFVEQGPFTPDAVTPLVPGVVNLAAGSSAENISAMTNMAPGQDISIHFSGENMIASQSATIQGHTQDNALGWVMTEFDLSPTQPYTPFTVRYRDANTSQLLAMARRSLHDGSEGATGGGLAVEDKTAPRGGQIETVGFEADIPDWEIPTGGFVVIHRSNAAGEILEPIGHSGYLAPGDGSLGDITEYEGTIPLNAPITETTRVVGMLHLDVNGNQAYDGLAVDQPWPNAVNDPVLSSGAVLRVPQVTSTTPTPTPEPRTVTVIRTQTVIQTQIVTQEVTVDRTVTVLITPTTDGDGGVIPGFTVGIALLAVLAAALLALRRYD